MQRRDGFFFCFTAWKSRLVIHRQNFSRMGTRSNDHKQSLTKNGKSVTGSICQENELSHAAHAVTHNVDFGPVLRGDLSVHTVRSRRWSSTLMGTFFSR